MAFGKKRTTGAKASDPSPTKGKKAKTTSSAAGGEEAAPEEPSALPPQPEGGSYDHLTREWKWQLKSDTFLRVTQLKGKTYVDIRKYWNDKPTTKGVCLPLDVFKEVQSWSKLDEAVDSVEKQTP